MLKEFRNRLRKPMGKKQKYESQRGKYRVEVDGENAVIEILGKQTLQLEDRHDLIDLFVVIASVLNQIYDDDHFQ